MSPDTNIEKLTDLSPFKEDYSAILEARGITSPAQLAAALSDKDEARSIMNELPGVGPKTIESWKAQLGGGSKAIEPASAKKPARKVPAETEIVEAESEVEEEGAYKVKAKPVLDDETKALLKLRNEMGRERIAFLRQEWYRFPRLGEKWRRPRGMHSKMRRHICYRPNVVSIGYRGPAQVRGLHPSGFAEVLVHNADQLEGLDPKAQAVRIGSSVGARKREIIQSRADELGIRVLNRTV